MHSGTRRYKRLRWLCRRGMKELDVLLEAFLVREADALNRGEHPLLEDLLKVEDDVLWDWLQGRERPEERGWCELVERIRG